jgi:hypothetical protein
MIWSMMILSGLLACIFSAVFAAGDAKLGPEGYALLIGIAALVGIANAWAMNRAADTFVRRTSSCSEEMRERYARLLYLTGFVWLFVPVFLILWTSEHLLVLRSH